MRKCLRRYGLLLLPGAGARVGPDGLQRGEEDGDAQTLEDKVADADEPETNHEREFSGPAQSAYAYCTSSSQAFAYKIRSSPARVPLSAPLAGHERVD